MASDGTVRCIGDLRLCYSMLTFRRHKSHRSDRQLQYDGFDDPAMLYYGAVAQYPGHGVLASQTQPGVSVSGIGTAFHWVQPCVVLDSDVLLQHRQVSPTAFL